VRYTLLLTLKNNIGTTVAIVLYVYIYCWSALIIDILIFLIFRLEEEEILCIID